MSLGRTFRDTGGVDEKNRRHLCGPPSRDDPAPAGVHLALRYLLPAGCLFINAILPGTVYAIGFDEVRQQSGLGEPLRLVIPIIVNEDDQISGDDLAGECFTVVPATTNDVPQLHFPRVTLERRGQQAFVVLTTTYAIEEPIVRVAVQGGCRVHISREYTLFFDPISVQPPTAQVAEARVQQRLGSRSADGASSEPASRQSAEEGTELRASRPAQRSSAPRQRSSAASGMKPRAETGTTSVKVATGVTTQPAPARKPAPAPRLEISRTIGDAESAPAATMAKSVADRESLMALEEQTVVLQKRIAELSAQLEHIDGELRAAQAARALAEKKAALTETEHAAMEGAPPEPSTWRRWLADNWPLLVLVSAVIALLALLLTQRRGRRPLVPRPFTATQAASFNAADLGEPSVPNPEDQRDGEGVVGSIKDPPRAHMIPPVHVDPIERGKSNKTTRPQTHYEYPGIGVAEINAEDVNFDEEVRKAYEAASEYSVLEREQPGIVARLKARWRTPSAAKLLDGYLLTPRPGGRSLSRGAIEELKLLRSIVEE